MRLVIVRAIITPRGGSLISLTQPAAVLGVVRAQRSFTHACSATTAGMRRARSLGVRSVPPDFFPSQPWSCRGFARWRRTRVRPAQPPGSRRVQLSPSPRAFATIKIGAERRAAPQSDAVGAHLFLLMSLIATFHEVDEAPEASFWFTSWPLNYVADLQVHA